MCVCVNTCVYIHMHNIILITMMNHLELELHPLLSENRKKKKDDHAKMTCQLR